MLASLFTPSFAAPAPAAPLLNISAYDEARTAFERVERAKYEHEIMNLNTAVEGAVPRPAPKLVSKAAASPVQLIIDTDLGFDVDDAGAIAIANHLQDIGACMPAHGCQLLSSCLQLPWDLVQ